jgi:hypothetical protein
MIKKPLFCSFCGKSQHEVAVLIAGPCVFICDECVKICNGVVAEKLEQLPAVPDTADSEMVAYRETFVACDESHPDAVPFRIKHVNGEERLYVRVEKREYLPATEAFEKSKT